MANAATPVNFNTAPRQEPETPSIYLLPTPALDERGNATDDLEMLRFDPQKLLARLEAGEHEYLCLDLFAILKYFESRIIDTVRPEDRQTVNVLAKLILMIFADERFQIPEKYALAFIRFAVTISNLVRLSDFRNTDLILKAVSGQKGNLVKFLTLYTPRNTVKADLEALFKQDPMLVSHWWTQVLDTMRNSNTETIWRNMHALIHTKGIEHLVTHDPRFKEMDTMTHAGFWVSYIDPSREIPIKRRINEEISKLVFPPAPSGKADFRKILFPVWFFREGHAVYKALSGMVASLKGHYHLTQLVLEPKKIDWPLYDTGIFDETLYFFKEEGGVDQAVAERTRSGEWGTMFLTDVGMNMISVAFANTRVAPIQIAAYGHPVTTASPEVDYFIGGQETETPNHPERFYTERLVLLPGMGTKPVYPAYKRQNPPKPVKNRVVVSCAWGSVKFHYPHLLNLKKVAEAAKTPVTFLFSGLYSQKFALPPFREELEELLGKERVIATPTYQYADYMRQIESSDFGVDCIPFGSYNRIIDTLYNYRPMVAYETERAYSRLAAAVMRRIGMPELVATNDREFIDITLRLVDDAAWRQSLSDRLREMSDTLESRISGDNNAHYLRKAIDYLIANHAELQKQTSRKPILIAED